MITPRPLSALAGLFLASALPAIAQDWLLIDKFDGGAPQATWTKSSGMSLIYTDDQLAYKTGSGNTEWAYVPLPQEITSGKLTVAFDLKLPAGQAQNQAGFGIGDQAQVSPPNSGWLVVGTKDRYQTGDPKTGGDNTKLEYWYPQFLLKAQDWENDLLDPTLQGVWYNLWVVYDFDAQSHTLYGKKSTEPLESVKSLGSWALGDPHASFKYFTLGAGGAWSKDYPALGGIIDNLYMAVGENLSLSPTSLQNPPPAWTVLDTFDGGVAQGTWAGDLASLNLNFLGENLLLKAAADTKPNMYLALPETVTTSRLTVTFDLFLPNQSKRNDSTFGVVGDSHIASQTGWNRVGGNDRFLTFGGTVPQPLTKYLDWSTDLLGPTQLGQWFHIWLVYDLPRKTVSFYRAKLGDPIDNSTPRAIYDLAGTYENFHYFVIGVDNRNAAGIAIDNLYYANDELLTASPTAGEVHEPGVASGCTSVYPASQQVAGYAPGIKLAHNGFIYDGFYPFIWHFDYSGWLYVFGCGNQGVAVDTGYYLYDFKRAEFGFAMTAYANFYFIVGGPNNGAPVFLGAP